jgi:hypothetical protein
LDVDEFGSGLGWGLDSTGEEGRRYGCGREAMVGEANLEGAVDGREGKGEIAYQRKIL